ncbi:MAG TPA: hypothetical protein VK454_00830 [Myxococcaceae bacterium]|nr:hypothetical protein [Myxococcaceae bacterium]
MSPSDPPSDVRSALQRQDPFALAAAPPDEVERLKKATELIEADQKRRQARNRFAVASQVLVAWVAIAGFLVNAYQSYANKVNQERQAKVDQERWDKEFQRAREADKYRSFFESSLLATDATNADKRLVGYALLQEFVRDDAYNTKATLMLEESLVQELRSNTESGIDEQHRNAVVAIVTALADSNDCHALQRAARSFDKVAKRHQKFGDVDETSEVFRVYVRRLVGQAAEACGKRPDDFKNIRKPLRDTLIKQPGIGGLRGDVKVAAANVRVAEILRDRCLEDVTFSGASDCPDIFKGYATLCESKEMKVPEEAGACALMEDVNAKLIAATAAAHAVSVPPPSPADAGP